MNRSTIRMVSALFLVFSISALSPPFFGQAEEPDHKKSVIRELYVPFEDLDALLGSDTHRVFMSRSEFEDLKTAAELEPEQKPPHRIDLIEADYAATVRDGRAIIQGTLVLDVLDDGLQAFRLGFQGVGVRFASLDEAPASLVKTDGDAAMLFVQGKGQHELKVELVTSVTIDAAQQTMNLALPTAAASRMTIEVPGNVEIKSGASVVDRMVDDDRGITRFRILPSPEPMSVTMSLNNRKMRDQTTVMARGVVVSEVTEAYERLHASISHSVVNGATDEVRFTVGDDLDVESVSCPLLSRWEIEQVEGRKTLVVRLRSPTTDRVVVNVRLDRGKPALSGWTIPEFEPVDVAGYSAVVGLVTEDRLRVSEIRSESLFTIDSQVLVEATAASVFAEEPGAPRVNAIAAFYAASASYSLSAELKLPVAELAVNANSLFSVSDQEISVAGGLNLTPAYEDLFSFDLLLPPNWNLVWVRDGVDSAVKFERYEEASGTRIRVLLPQGMKEGQTGTIWFKATHVPTDWLSDWQEQTIELPAFPVVGADEHEGVIALQLSDDLEATPVESENLVLIGESEKSKHQLQDVATALAYQYDDLTWNASVRLSRLVARQTARVLSFVRVDTEAFVCHTEIIYLVTEARSRTLQFSLPESTPSEVGIAAFDGVPIKETSSEVVDGRRVWTVELADRRSGSIRLSVDFNQQLDSEEPKEAELPIARAESVQYQTGAIALEGHPELDTTVTRSPRAVDIGELVDAEYQVGKRLIGVYGYVSTDDGLVVDIDRRAIHALPSTIVERAEMVSQLSAQGKCQTGARFRLRTKATMLECLLPQESTLWAVMVDGKPSLPQRINQSVIVTLPAGATNPIRDLQIVFESSVKAMRLATELEVFAPELYERTNENGQGPSIPTADLKWQLFLPDGYRATYVDGRVIDGSRWVQAESGVSDGRLSETLMRFGGGNHLGWFAAQGMVRESYSSEVQMDMMGGIEDEMMLMEDFASEGLPASGSGGRQFYRTPQVERFMDQIPVEDESAAQPAFAAPNEPAAAEQLAVPQSSLPAGGATASAAQKSKPGQVQLSKQPWALEGVRSLAIDLSRAGSTESVSLARLGDRSRARLRIVDARRFQWIAAAVGLFVFLIGLTARDWNARVRFFFLAVVAITIIPELIGWSTELQATQISVVAALLALAAWSIIRSLGEAVRLRFGKRQASSKTVVPSNVVASLAIGMVFLSSAAEKAGAQQADPFGGAATVTNAEQLDGILRRLGLTAAGAKPPVAIPSDAVVVPYKTQDGGPEANVGAENAIQEKLLVPYEVYEHLWALAYPNKKLQITPPPMPFAWSNVRYSATLDRSGTLTMDGSLQLEQFVDGQQIIPLPIAGGVLEKATLDGKPAKLKLIQSQDPVQAEAAQQKPSQQALAQNASPPTILLLHSSGKGVKSLELRLRIGLGKSGGWRIASGQVPSAPACGLTLTVENANTEVRISGIEDRTDYSTSEANETIETALLSGGAFSIRWRDQISEARIDQGMTVASKAIFDVRQDAIRLAWQADFGFRRGRREMLQFIVPSDYLVEKIVGDNVRGWTLKETTDGQQIDVELLKPAVEHESLIAILSKRQVVAESNTESISVPNPIVPDAMLQQGRLTIRQSSLLQLRAGETSGLSRIDLPDESGWYAAIDEPGPLPMETFQAYQFNQSNFGLPLTASVIPEKKSVEVQSLLKLSQRETVFESRLSLTAKDRPVYKLRVRLPDSIELDAPEAPGAFQWEIMQEDGGEILEIDLADGQLGAFNVILKGKLPAMGFSSQDDSVATVDLPSLDVLDTEKQIGAIVVQIDPAFNVRATGLQGCSTGSLATVNHWLQGQQRQLVRTVIRYESPQYQGALSITRKRPIVDSLAVTNVKVTDRAVEETIYIEANISSAGISEYSFVLPTRLADARIVAPLIRQKLIEPIEDGTGEGVRVKLQLQDTIMGRFAIIVSNDRLIGSGVQTIPIPAIETGNTKSRLLTLENASRDELVTDELVSVEAIDRVELGKNKRLDQLGGKSSLIFRVQESQTATASPQLSYQTKTRETIETSGARIGLAKTLLIIDQLGTYRSMQEYRVENRTEPFLEVAMPEGSRLWTVQVAGENVKPSSPSAGVIRVPLIKTAEGDLDYPVIMKYGGRIDRPGNLKRIVFPLMRTVNINVELSQVRLRLPEEIDWFGFDGTMGRVLDESELEAGWLSFRTRQITDLTRLLSSKKGEYSKVRAQYNLKQLGEVISKQNSYYAESQVTNEELQQQLQDNKAALEEAKEQIDRFEQQSGGGGNDLGNRFALNELYEAQANYRSKNVASTIGSNFASPNGKDKAGKGVAGDGEIDIEKRFDRTWLDGNSLSQERVDGAIKSRIGTVELSDEDKPATTTRQSKRSSAQAAPSKQRDFGNTNRGVDEQIAAQRITGDYKAQAERYRKRLQANQSGRTNVNDMEMDMGRMGVDDGMMMGMGGMAMAEPSSRTTAEIESGGQFQLRTSGQQGNDSQLPEQLGALGLQDADETSDPFGAVSGGRGFAGGGMGGGGMGGGGMGGGFGDTASAPGRDASGSVRQTRGQPTAAGFLASLEVNLPVRGKEYLFTTPGGELELNALAMDQQYSQRIVRCLILVGISLVFVVLYRFLAKRKSLRSQAARVFFSVLAGVTGTAMLVSGFLPIYGLFLLLICLCLAFSTANPAVAANA